MDVPKTGFELAALLKALATEYHVKSDKHEILLWEALVVEAKSRDLVNGEGVVDNLRESVLLNSWGKSHFNESEKIYKRVYDFHQAYNHEKNR